MNTDNNRDFRDRLHGLGQAGAKHEPLLPDDAAAASIRSHAANARRRERIARTSIATVCVMTLVAGGFGAYRLVNDPVPASFAGPAAPHGGSEDPAVEDPTPDDSVEMTECGTDYVPPKSTSALSLVSEAHTDKDGKPLSTDGSDAKRWETSLVGYGTTIPLLLKNTSSKKSFEGGSTGYAWIVVTQKGKVVSAGGGMPQPYNSFDLKPGETSPITAVGTQPCPGVDYMTGDFEVTAIVDYSLDDPAVSSGVAVGGPWSIRVGSTPTPIMPSAEVLGCGAMTQELAASASPNKLTASLETNADETLFTLKLEKPRDLVSMSDLQIAILKDDAVVSAPLVDREVINSLATTGTITGVMMSTKGGGEDCHGDPLEPGEYEVIAVSVVTDASNGAQLTHMVSNRAPYTIK